VKNKARPALEERGHVKIYSLIQKINNSLAIGLKKCYFNPSIKPRLIKSGRFLSEGTIHLSKWHPPVCNVENFKKGECYYD